MLKPKDVTVATVIEERDRHRLDAAADGYFTTLHVNSVREAHHAVRERAVRLILVSPRCVARDELPGVARLVRGFPEVPTAAVLSQHDPQSSERLLELGVRGVERLFDLGSRHGWRQLRDVISRPTSPTAAVILGKVCPALDGTTRDGRRFFEILVRRAPSTTTVRSLVGELGVRPSTFMSRFFRAQLPSPKRYLAAMRIVYAAGLLESPALSIADAAYQLEFSSPQSFGRHLRAALGLTAGEFRRRYPLQTALEDFVARFILPFRSVLRTFHPLENGVERTGRRG